MLTKVTKYAATLFLALSLTLYVIEARGKTGKSGVDKELEKTSVPAAPAASSVPAATPTVGQPTPFVSISNFPPATNIGGGTSTPLAAPKAAPATNPPTATSPAVPKK